MKPRQQNPFPEGKLRYDMLEAAQDWAEAICTGGDVTAEFCQRAMQDHINLENAAADAKRRLPDVTDEEERTMLRNVISDMYRRKACDRVMSETFGTFLRAAQSISQEEREADPKGVSLKLNRILNHELDVRIKLLYSEWKDKGENSVRKLFLNCKDAEFVRDVLAYEYAGDWAGNKRLEDIREKIVLTQKDGKTMLTMPVKMLMDLSESEQIFDMYHGRHF